MKRIPNIIFLLALAVMLSDSGCGTRAGIAPAGLKAGSGTARLGPRLLAAAMNYKGVRYVSGGRSSEGVDAVGLIFLSYLKATGKDWDNLATWPRMLVETEALGKPVEGLQGVPKGMIDFAKIAKGDIIYFLIPFRVGSDADPLVIINKVEYWAWTMGISAGKAQCLHARSDDRVRIDPIDELLGEDDAIFVTRLE